MKLNTYENLLGALLTMTPEELANDLTIWDYNDEEFYKVEIILKRNDPNHEFGDILDEGHPYLDLCYGDLIE